MALEAFQIAIQEQFPEADFTKGKFGFSKNDPRYEKARTIFRKVTGKFKAYEEKRKTDPKRLEYKANYVPPPESVAKRKAKQKLEYEKNPEKFLTRNREDLTRPDIQEKRSKYMQDRYYFGGQREKDLLRLKGVVASKGYGGYFKNPDNALLKDMVRMAEQNPDSGLEIIRKGPRNLIVGVKEGDTIYHAVASKRKPVAYAPKNSVPITEHPDFKTRFEFTKLQKNFLNTKLKGSDLTYGKALDISQLAALIKDSSFVVANDTGPAHMTAHLGSKGIALFGSHTTPFKVSIERENFKAIQAPELSKLSVEKVFEKLSEIIS